MLTEFQNKILSKKIVNLLDVSNHLNYNDGVISGVQAVRVDTKQADGIIITADVAFEFEGCFVENDLVFSILSVVQTDICKYSDVRILERVSPVAYTVSPKGLEKAKEAISNYVKQNLSDLFYFHRTHSKNKVITSKSTTLADGVTLQKMDLSNVYALGSSSNQLESPSAVFVVNGKEVHIEFKYRLGIHNTNPIYNEALEEVKASERVVYLEELTALFLHTKPIEADEDDDYNYTYLPNDPDFTYEQKISIANYLAYEGFKNAMQSEVRQIIGVYGEHN